MLADVVLHAVIGNTYGGEGCVIKEMTATPMFVDNKAYVPVEFIEAVYNTKVAITTKTIDGKAYVEVETIAKVLGKAIALYTVQGTRGMETIAVIGNKAEFFNMDKDKYIFSTADWTTIDIEKEEIKKDSLGNTIIEFNLIPLYSNIDGAIYLTGTNNTLSEWGDAPIAVRMFTNGQFEARNAGVYTNDKILEYEAGVNYHFKVTVDVNAKKYSVEITDENGVIYAIATDYAFRTGAQNIENIGKICVRGGAAAPAKTVAITFYDDVNDDNNSGNNEDVLPPKKDDDKEDTDAPYTGDRNILCSYILLALGSIATLLTGFKKKRAVEDI